MKYIRGQKDTAAYKNKNLFPQELPFNGSISVNVK